MDPLSPGEPLAPPARIRRLTGSQRAFLPLSLARTDLLLRLARMEPAAARAAADGALEPLRSALARSPFWRERLRAAGLAPGDLRTLADLAHFPVLDRATLAERWADLPVLAPDDPASAEAVVVLSSGTTGDPVRVLRDRYDCLHMWAVLRFWLRALELELPPRPRIVLLCSLPGGLEYSVRLPLLGDGALHRLSLHRPRARERLRRAAPAVIFTDPEGLHWLAANADACAPRLLLTSASRFGEAQREMVRRALPAPVLNYYSTTETGALAWECLRAPGRFHVLLPDVWVEAPAGRLLATRLRPSALPLLRYDTGDAGTVVEGECACGHRGPSITGFEGRRACAFRRADGGTVDAWQLAWLFKHHALRSFRLTQLAPERFLLELEGSPAGARAALAHELGQALRRLGFGRPEVEVRGGLSPDAGPKPDPFRSLPGGPGEAT